MGSRLSVRKNRSKTEETVCGHTCKPDVITESEDSKTVMSWGQSTTPPIEDPDVKERCGECTCDDCHCVSCGSSGGKCGIASNANDVLALEAKFNPDIQETHLKCLKQNGCPCDPCSCYPFKCQPQQLKDEEPEVSKQLETPIEPIEQLTEQLDALSVSVDPSVVSNACEQTEVFDTCTVTVAAQESQLINEELDNCEIVALN